MERLCDVTLLLLPLLLVSPGMSRANHEGARVVGGEEAADGEYPQQESDVITTSSSSPATELTVVSGTNSLTEGGNVHSCEKVIPHPGFTMVVPYPDDIGQIKVNPPFNLDGVLEAPAKLPAAGQQVPSGSPATIIGWGMMWESGDIPDMLRKVEVLIRDHGYCGQVYGQLYNVTISDRQVCADVAEGGKAPCKGDSGGPLLVDGQVVGISSWLYGCGRQGYPGVFTNVASYVGWINTNMADN